MASMNNSSFIKLDGQKLIAVQCMRARFGKMMNMVVKTHTGFQYTKSKSFFFSEELIFFVFVSINYGIHRTFFDRRQYATSG